MWRGGGGGATSLRWRSGAARCGGGAALARSSYKVRALIVLERSMAGTRQRSASSGKFSTIVSLSASASKASRLSPRTKESTSTLASSARCRCLLIVLFVFFSRVLLEISVTKSQNAHWRSRSSPLFIERYSRTEGGFRSNRVGINRDARSSSSSSLSPGPGAALKTASSSSSESWMMRPSWRS